MPLSFACFWQVVSEALAWESSTHNILTSWHLSPSYQGLGYSSLITVSILDIHANLAYDCILPGQLWERK